MDDAYLRQRIENWVSDFCASDVGQGLSPAIREYAFDIGVRFLVAACDARSIEPAEIEESDVRAAMLGSIARLKLPAAARECVPGLCGALLWNLGEEGRISGGIMLAAYARALGEGFLDKASDKVRPITRPGSKLNRNDPCPCGSGKKYKKCCMKDD